MTHHKKPKLIILSGFAGSGKTTIAKMYIDNHPLALDIEGDELIVNIGHWLDNEDEARDCTDALTHALAATHLKSGKDVIVPYLIAHNEQVTPFEKIAQDHDADFYDITLLDDRESALTRLKERGTWGEKGLPPLAEEDFAIAEKLYDSMSAALEQRPHSKIIDIEIGQPEATYTKVLEIIDALSGTR